jgi:hypothetical protein
VKIEMADATGCPVPQFVVRPETEEEQMLVKAFIGLMNMGGWRFHFHGAVHEDGRITSFNFGLAKTEFGS